MWQNVSEIGHALQMKPFREKQGFAMLQTVVGVLSKNSIGIKRKRN